MKNKGTEEKDRENCGREQSDHRMFTGIIEEIGEIAGVKRGQVSSPAGDPGKKIFSDLKLGDSVAVNGVCLTATSISGDIFEADVMAETSPPDESGPDFPTGPG